MSQYDSYIEYTAGLMFDLKKQKVALIQKTKPDWQKGFWNGIGGKVENNDTTILSANVREFYEETGVTFQDWEEIAIFQNCAKSYQLFWFTAFTDDVFNVKTTTEEKVKIFSVNKLPKKLAPNVEWLIKFSLLKSDSIQTPIIINDV